MSDAELEQRKIAGTVHGAYAFRDHGAEALPEKKRSRIGELSESVQTRAGLLSLLQDRAVRAIIMVEIVESYIVEEKRKGKPLESISILRNLPGFQNSAQRCIEALLDVMPGDNAPANAELIRIQKVIDDDDKQYSE
jgi:hypothetical protein